MMPNGSGNLLGDSAYGGIKNCDTVRDSGRRPIIYSKSNAIPNGHNARDEMLRFRDEHPRTFYNILRIRNNVDGIFSSMKDRFGGIVRALNLYTQSIELLSMCICYNMTFE